MDRLLDKFIDETVRGMDLKDKITGFMVKKKRRGTFQALEESTEVENIIVNNVVDYIHGWILNEFIDGKLKDKLSSEIYNAVFMELVRSGYADILKKPK